MNAKNSLPGTEFLVTWSFKGIFTSNFPFFFLEFKNLPKDTWVQPDQKCSRGLLPGSLFHLCAGLCRAEVPASTGGKAFGVVRPCLFPP